MFISDEPLVVLCGIAIRSGPECHRRYSDSLKAGRYGAKTPVSVRDFLVLHNRHGRPCLPPSLLYGGYLGPFSSLKRPGRGVNH